MGAGNERSARLLARQSGARGVARAADSARLADRDLSPVLRFAQKPLVLDEIYLPGELFESFSLDALKEWRGSLYSFFETRFGVRMVRAEERLKAVAADRVTAEALGWPSARRSSSSNGLPTPITIAQSSGAKVFMRPSRTTTTMNSPDRFLGGCLPGTQVVQPGE